MRAGFQHVASFDVLDICGATLRQSRPAWAVFSGNEARCDTAAMVTTSRARWMSFTEGRPASRFRSLGKGTVAATDRDMWPAFIAAVREIEPAAFVAENVPGLLDAKFRGYVQEAILTPLAGIYQVARFQHPRLRTSAYRSCAAVSSS